jgi:hypothetical protein
MQNKNTHHRELPLLRVGAPGTQEDGLSMHTTMNKSIQKRLDYMKQQFEDLSATLQTNDAVRTRLLVARRRSFTGRSPRRSLPDRRRLVLARSCLRRSGACSQSRCTLSTP